VVVEEPDREPAAAVVIGALMGLVIQTVTRVEDVGHVLTGDVLAKVPASQELQSLVETVDKERVAVRALGEHVQEMLLGNMFRR
jgi:hypothetical protein